jgi:hypothetical protein
VRHLFAPIGSSKLLFCFCRLRVINLYVLIASSYQCLCLCEDIEVLRSLYRSTHLGHVFVSRNSYSLWGQSSIFPVEIHCWHHSQRSYASCLWDLLSFWSFQMKICFQPGLLSGAWHTISLHCIKEPLPLSDCLLLSFPTLHLHLTFLGNEPRALCVLHKVLYH